MTTPDFFLFVSHVSNDQSAAMDIVGELERRGVPCWIAPRNIRPGKPFDDEIAEAIDGSRAMLLIFSEQCNESEYIRREVTVAVKPARSSSHSGSITRTRGRVFGCVSPIYIGSMGSYRASARSTNW